MTISLVTGGGGFLGGAIIRRLRDRGESVRSFTRSTYPWLTELGVPQISGDLGSSEDVLRALEGVEVVYHVAAKAGVWGRYSEYYHTNVTGTRNILAACKAHGIRKLVYTSTPSVVHSGRDIEGGNETLPYPRHFEAAYPKTKAIAEREVLAANSPELATVALRPHLIWGPGDPHLIPRLLRRAQAGKLKRIGKRDVKVDVTFIDNAAEAHILAGQRIGPGAACAGRAYFLSDGTPVVLWEFLNRILADHGLEPVTKSIPAGLAKFAGATLETVYRLLRIRAEPAMTRFVASQLSTSHWYDISAAIRDLNYRPIVSTEEGLIRLRDSQRRSNGAM